VLGDFAADMNSSWKKNVVLFLASQTVSLFGSSLVQYAIMWYLTLTTQSGVVMTASVICGFLPTFFLSPFAGVWADRYNRKALIMISDAFIAVSTLAVAILFFMGYDALWLLFAVSALRALGTGIQTPAVGAILPQIVPEDKLTRVNATNTSVQSLVTLLSPVLSAALLAVLTIEEVFLIDVVTAAIAISILLALRVATHAKASGKQASSYFSDMREGLAYIKNHGFVRNLCLFSAVFYVLVAPLAFLTPLPVARSYGEDVWRLSATEVTCSMGMIVGGLIMASWGGLRNKAHTMSLSNLAIGACSFALGATPAFWLYLVFMAVCGFAFPVFNTPSTVLLQQKVKENFLGRVFGFIGMLASIMMPLGMLVFGPIADRVPIEWLLVGTGLLMVVMSLFMFGNRELVEAGAPVAVPES
jgi:DHA3 family macrolide efflux protein-like MFS transporter